MRCDAVNRAGRPALAAACVTVTLWASAFVAIRSAGQHFSPGALALGRLLAGVLVLGLIWLGRREGWPPRAAWPGIAACGVLWFGVCLPARVLLCLVAAVSYAASAVSQKSALRHASPLQVTTFGCAIGALACLPFAGQFVTQLATAPLGTSLSAVYLGVFPTAVAFTTWAYALARTPVGALGATVYAVPALTVLMSWGILGEVPRAATLAGGALCLTGVAISRRRPGKPGRPRRVGLGPPGTRCSSIARTR
jgi:drug/metabolite transporter (DMT)-like permease